MLDPHPQRVSAPRALRRLAALAAATFALAAALAGSGAAIDLQHGIAFTKGCVSSTPIGSPYSCTYTIRNIVDDAGDTVVVTGLEDVVAAASGPVPSGNVLPSLRLVAAGGSPSCNGTGSGTATDPWTGATECTLPFGSRLDVQLFSHYVVQVADYGLPNHTLLDEASLTWRDLCDGDPGPGSNCASDPPPTSAGSATVVTPVAPTFTSGASAATPINTPFAFTVTTTGAPAAAIAGAGLPGWLTLTDHGDGTATLAGTPTTKKVVSFTLTATNDGGSVQQTFTLTAGQAPVITSAAAVTATVGKSLSFQVAASAFPAATFAATGALPAGIAFSAAGRFTGTPQPGSGGVYALVIDASNAVGAVQQSFTLTVNEAPVVTSAASLTVPAGSPFTFGLTATGHPAATFSKSGTLPSGVTLAADGTLSGTPAAGSGGAYPLTISAKNAAGVGKQSFVLTVTQPPAITSAAAATTRVGSSFTFQTTASGYPAPTFSTASPLPAGITLSASGRLSGQPAAGTAGTYTIALVATNAVGSATQTFVLTVRP